MNEWLKKDLPREKGVWSCNSHRKVLRNIAIRYIDTVYVYDIDRIEVNLKFQSVLDRALSVAEQI